MCRSFSWPLQWEDSGSSWNFSWYLAYYQKLFKGPKLELKDSVDNAYSEQNDISVIVPIAKILLCVVRLARASQFLVEDWTIWRHSKFVEIYLLLYKDTHLQNSIKIAKMRYVLGQQYSKAIYTENKIWLI
jgi:hypothetical protein